MIDAASFTLPYDHALCTALASRAWRPTLVRSAGWEGPWDHPGYESRVHFGGPSGLPALRRVTRGFSHALDSSRLARLIREQRPDIVHFQWFPLPVVDRAVVRAARRVAPVVFTMHNTTVFHGGRSLQGIGLRSTIASCDAVIVHTEYSRDRALEQGWVSPERLHVIPHGVFDYHREPVPATRPGVETDEVVILFFGNLKPYKGVDLLIRAVAALDPSVRWRVRLVIAGPGGDVASLRELAANGGIASQVEWKNGFVPESQVAGLFQRADFVVLPYREIDQSGVLLTAIGLGTPIIASRLGGIPETVVDGEEALLVEPGSHEALAEAIHRMASDPGLRQCMRTALGRLRTGRLGWDSIAASTAELYGKLLHRKAAA